MNPRDLFEQRSYALCLRYRGGDKAAGGELLLMHGKLVKHLVKRYCRTDAKLRVFDDLIQEGCMSMLHAAELFDPSFGVRFSTYAVPWVRNGVSRYWLSQKDIVRSPFRKIRDGLAIKTISVEDDAFKRAVSRGRDREWTDIVPNEDVPVDELLADVDIAEASRVVVEWLDSVTPKRVGDVIRRRHLTGEATLQEIGDAYGITKERTRQLESRYFERAEYLCRNAVLPRFRVHFDRGSIGDRIALIYLSLSLERTRRGAK